MIFVFTISHTHNPPSRSQCKVLFLQNLTPDSSGVLMGLRMGPKIKDLNERWGVVPVDKSKSVGKDIQTLTDEV